MTLKKPHTQTHLTIGDVMVATGNFWVLAALARMKILISGTVWSLPNRDAATQKAQTQGAHEKGKRLSSPKYTGRKGKRKRKNIQVLEN